ncbi:probable RNA-directed DNA polymerase from transposon X-element [Trichonephila clavipes]|uniref:Probable RNA-directed DNA polymerase from transposon X-element n=1 Tax=Trichonephila clavipes TaxID=2585209 RepID=A0A8X6UXH8_TRICX|nr:probable RNA-directed DNA polymerase from transposon X-element [Trichonephila clavipes]
MTSIANWSERTDSTNTSTTTTGLGASPSRVTTGDELIAEKSDLFREAIRARNVYAAWARKLTNARPNDPKLQEFHMEVTKAGESVNSLLSQLDVPLFKIPASEKELDKILLRLKNKPIDPPAVKNHESKAAAVPPSPPPLPVREKRRENEALILKASLPPKQLVRKARSPRSSPPPSPTPPSATSVEDARLEGEEEEMDSSQPAELQDQVVVPEVVKKPRIPPFFVSPKGDWKQLVALAKLVAPSFQSQMSGRFLKVTVGDELEYRNLSRWLEQSGVEFKSFMLKQDRPVKVVIRGLPSNTEPEDIKNEIEAEGFKVAKISQMKNYRTKAPMPLFYLQIENGADAPKIFNFTELFGTRIEVKPFDRGNKINQCWRCQGWFHSSEVCHLPPRCVRCAGPHLAKDCTRSFDEPLKCANCSGEHAANWSRCPKHPKNAQKKNPNNNNKNKNGPKPKNNLNQKKVPQDPRPDISKARKVSPNLNYSKVVQNQIPRSMSSAGRLKTPFPRSARHLRTWINHILSSKLTETWLEPGIDPQIANYRLFKDDMIEFPHTVTRGGTAIYCKNEIVHNRVPLPATPGIDATAVQIKIKNAPPLNIVSAYIRKCAQSRFPSEDFKKIFNSGSNCIIAGDFNASHVAWHNVKNTRYGISLRNLVSNLRGAKLVAPQTATHLQPRQRFGSIIDLAVFKHIPYNHSVRVLSDLSSDHYPIKSKIHQRNRLRKFWQRSRCPSIYSEFRTLSREIAKDIKSHSQAQWEKHIEALSPEDNTLWRKSSHLRKPFHAIPPLKGALGSTAITPIEKAEVIADSLQEQFEPNHVADREVFDQRIHEEVANFLATPHVQEIEPTTPTEVLTYVQRIKPKKSPGLDQISNRMLKNLPLKFLLFITLLINQLFKNNYFPDSWKTAVVIPLKPDKNPELAQNYRPISLLSCLSKVYEFVLLQRLNQHCAAFNFIIPQQCGFRPKCSTVHQLLRVTELIHSGFAKHEATGILFLDIAKAFDKIWHDGLKTTLMGGKLLNLMASIPCKLGRGTLWCTISFLQ